MNIFKYMINKKIEEFKKEKKDRIDINLPLNLKFNSQIEISKTPFMLSEKMLIDQPIDDVHIVTGIGKIDLGFDNVFHRFYLEELKNPENKSILQVQAESFMFFKPYETLDLNDDIVSAFLDETDGLIGLKDFIITDDEKYVYNRISPLPEKGGRHNVTVNEKTIFDPFGDTGCRVESLQAMYSRDVEGITEYCLVSRDKIFVSNYERVTYGDLKEASISILLGIDLHLTDIKT